MSVPPAKTLETDLVQAAERLDEELRRFETLAQSVQKLPLNSQRNLERAASALKNIAESDSRLSVNVQALVAVIAHVRDAQLAHAQAVQTCATDLERRVAEFQKLKEHQLKLGQMASEISAVVQRIGSNSSTAVEGDGAGAAFDDAMARLSDAADVAHELTTLASEKDFSDVARETESLRQQLLAARNKMKLLADRLGSAGTGMLN